MGKILDPQSNCIALILFKNNEDDDQYWTVTFMREQSTTRIYAKDCSSDTILSYIKEKTTEKKLNSKCRAGLVYTG